MQPRSLDQVLSSLNSVYDPQIQSIQAQQAAIPGQIAEQEKGLQAKQETAFGDILNGARRRGTGVAFGGIPLSEQARYTADTYLPSLANLRAAGTQQQTSLADAINKINADKFTQGQGIYQYETNFAEQQRQFNEQQALARQQAADARASAAAFNPSLGGGLNQSIAAGAALTGGKTKDQAKAAVANLLNTGNVTVLTNSIKAIYDSAVNHGNTYDQAKLELLQAINPGLFNNGVPIAVQGSYKPPVASGLSVKSTPGLRF